MRVFFSFLATHLSLRVIPLHLFSPPAPLCSDDKMRPSYVNSLKMLISHIPYQRLVLGFVFSVLAFQVHFMLSMAVMHLSKQNTERFVV